ncbi:hypothetical protein [Hyalangium gracile]|uniref:hypothetical protein n=1 Tax=Hyalangium gracile TaxID=394092 RepID=UPI001CC9F58F|nr:hypothetical protein [Hyalangium gracile]
MRNLRLGVLAAALFVTACATLAPDSTPGRPNSTSSMRSSQQSQPKDPRDFVGDPTIGADPPRPPEKPLCRLQCGPNMHCDNSGFVERCVRDEEQKP